MKISALILAFSLLLKFTAIANASMGGSSVNVKIKNKVNSENSTFRSSAQTNVNIHQEGEGTSQVTVNDQEWNLEGPGDINVNQNSTPTSNTPAASPTQIPTPTPETTTPTLTPIPTTSPTEMPEEDESSNSSFSEILKERFEMIKESLQELFSKIFTIF